MWEVFEKNYIITQPICKKPYATTYQNFKLYKNYYTFRKLILQKIIDSVEHVFVERIQTIKPECWCCPLDLFLCLHPLLYLSEPITIDNHNLVSSCFGLFLSRPNRIMGETSTVSSVTSNHRPVFHLLKINSRICSIYKFPWRIILTCYLLRFKGKFLN